MSQNSIKLQTRGRPRKNNDQKLPPISRKLFSEHCAVFYACCMVYVLQIFLKTKQQKRIGHSEGGFTIYQKMNVQYCFDNFDQHVRDWKISDPILTNPSLYDFTKTINGSAPHPVFKQLLMLIVAVHNFLIERKVESLEDLQNNFYHLLDQSQSDLNKTFKYIRFTPLALRQIKMDKWSSEVNKKMKQLWQPFTKVIAYTVFCVEKGIEHNKYLKPFFSDAEHPEETIIGQLNLEQIVSEKYEKIKDNNQTGFIKIQKLEYEQEIPLDKKSDFVPADLPLNNKRPITLITFPSTPYIPKDSPDKLPLWTPQPRRRPSMDEMEEVSLEKKRKLQ